MKNFKDGEIKIFWTLSAKNDLKKIFDFYNQYFSNKIAINTIKNILNKVKTLTFGLELGQKEESLKHLKEGHRYLISKHNKIIYKIENNTAYITHVFDTRQSPDKLQKR